MEDINGGSLNQYLSEKDIDNRLFISQKIYGREKEIEELLGAFARVMQGSKELFFIAGDPGIGKTTLIKEIYHQITRERAYSIKGKFDQLQRSTPYSAFIEAFHELIHRLLSGPQAQLDKIRRTLNEVLGMNGQVMIDIIPDIILIIGAQPALPILSPQESQNRFILTFQNFIRVLAQPDHPLIICLDDLQWIDNASLNLLKIIADDVDLNYFYIIGAYRDNEISDDHPFIKFQQEIQQQGVKLNHIELTPLNEQDIKHLLVDSLKREMQSIEPLAALLADITHGNPFFIYPILEKLYQEQVLVFSEEECQWRWDMERIYQENITHNMVDPLLSQIHQLSTRAQTALELAACIGHTFTLKTLSMINKQSLLAAAGDLIEAVHANLIRPIGEQAHLLAWLKGRTEIDHPEKITYCFTHDLIQQSAYQLIPETEISYIHLTIGRILILDKPLQENDERLFEVLYHFNQGLAFIEDEKEKLMAAEANWWAGKKSKTSTAYQIACNYLKSGIELLPKDAWQTHYELAFSLYKELMECEYFMMNFQEANQHLDLLLKRSKTLDDKIEVYVLQLTMLEMHGKVLDAIKVGMHALSLLGVHFPLSGNKIHLIIAFLKIKLRIGFRNIRSIQLSPMTDERQKLIHKTAHKIYRFLYYYDENLFALMLSYIVYSSLKYGYTKETPLAYLGYGFVHFHLIKNYQIGTDYIYLAEKMIESVGNNAWSLFILGGFINPWRDSFEKSRINLIAAHDSALEVGNFFIGTLSLLFSVYISQIKGKNIAEMSKILKKNIYFFENLHCTAFKIILQEIKKTNSYLQNKNHSRLLQITPLATIIEPLKNKTEIVNICVIYARFYYISNLFEASLQAGKLYEQYAQFNLGIVTHAEGKFYYALALAALYDATNQTNKRRYAKKIKSICKQFNTWSRWSPERQWQPFACLLAAEQARIHQQILDATLYYEEAIFLAEEQGIAYLIGIACECAARFYLKIKKPKSAKTYLQKSHYAYTYWGAAAKAKQLEVCYAELLQTQPQFS